MTRDAVAHECRICGREKDSDNYFMCRKCATAWDRIGDDDDGTVAYAMMWAAKRARWFEKRRKK